MGQSLLWVGIGLLIAYGQSATGDEQEELAKLTKDLTAKVEKTKLAAIESLGKMGPKAAPALKDVCDRLLDRSPKVALAALVAVETIDPELYKPLSGYLLTPRLKWDIKAEYARALGKMGEQARPATAVLLANVQSEIEVSIRARTGGGEMPLPKLASEILRAIKAIKPDDPKTVAAVKAMAGPNNPEVELRHLAIEFLAEWAGDDAGRRKQLIPTLAAGLGDKDPQLARTCIGQAAAFGPDAKELLPALRKLKLSTEATVRDGASAAIQSIMEEPPGNPVQLPVQAVKSEAAAHFLARFGAAKAELLKTGGGTVESEQAVAHGLTWLAKQQKADGSWAFDAAAKDETTAATGMALLAFLGAGDTHQGAGKYAKNVQSGLNSLLKNLPLKGPNAGKFAKSGTMYAQAIGTLALCEAYGMTKDKKLLAPAQAAINYIQKAQAPNGSWGYQSGNPGDTSIVGWQIQALKAAELSKDIVVDPKVIQKAIQFLDFAAAGSRKAMYGYNNNTVGVGPATSLTAIGLLCRYYIDKWGPDNAGMAEGVIGLMGRAPSGTTKQPRKTRPAMDMYYFYYATQVVHFFEGDEWTDWNEGPKAADGTRKGGARDWLIELQDKQAGANQGSWAPDGGFIGRECGRLGTTAMSLLTLEVYYRSPSLSFKPKKVEDPKKIEEPKKP